MMNYKVSQIDCRSSSMDWLMRVFLQSHGETRRMNIGILPVFLMKHQWSREQKWYRVSTALKLTFRKTGIAISV